MDKFETLTFSPPPPSLPSQCDFESCRVVIEEERYVKPLIDETKLKIEVNRPPAPPPLNK